MLSIPIHTMNFIVHCNINVCLANMFEKLRLLVTLEMKVFHKSIYILQDEAMTETVDALIEDGSKFLNYKSLKFPRNGSESFRRNRSD